ncbi:putative zinc finger CCCH domain-containing protein 48 [Clonorchis sinensis]|uniref:Zinc finger CCCH domain-containing protein 48 n=1 Tax=Clonorchis sinensis TaxID=79923 RepID=A0A419PWH3_CLOSI|nr:putative zinc finger CCCH domain-containing protein 48 [Clonorchis sinensis]
MPDRWRSSDQDSSPQSPNIFKLLPKDLFHSPVSPRGKRILDDWSEFPDSSAPLKSTGSVTEINVNHGLHLTTRAGVPLVIQDPYTAEQLLLVPIKGSLIASLRQWSRLPEDVNVLARLILFHNMMSSAYEEFISVFGCLPSLQHSGKPYYLDYVMASLEDMDEREQLTQIMRQAQDIVAMNLDVELKDQGISEIFTDSYPKVEEAAHSTYAEVASHALEPALFCLRPPTDEGKVKRPRLSKPTNTQSRNKTVKIEDAVNNIRYKTQPCRHFDMNGGLCPAGDKCHFAHGPEELRNPQSHPKYRTKLCRNFAESGVCSFGDNCFFLHVASSPETKTTVQRENGPLRLFCNDDVPCMLAHCASDIREALTEREPFRDITNSRLSQ